MSGLMTLGFYLAVVFVLVFLITVATHLLGERHRQKGMLVPYESGIVPTGSARIRFPVDFYLVAVFFVIFDVAAVFLFAWAVSAKELGWPGFFAVLAFMVETVAGLAYIWKMGAFDWGKRRKREHLERHGVKG